MNLPIQPPILPMLAKRVGEMPEGDDWIFEPKWDGFRALVFKDGDDVFIQSRDSKPLARYFPGIVEAVRTQLPPQCVLDGEIVIATDGRLDFEALQLRLHPAASRVARLEVETPASIVFFDLLSEGNASLLESPFESRRAALETLLARNEPPIHLTPATRDRAVAADWFRRFEGAGLDGVMAKRPEGAYEPNKRVMLKVKHARTCECVVAGFRWHKGSDHEALGSLLLGLYNDDGELQHVGVCGAFTAEKRRELVGFLEPYRANGLEDHPWKQWVEWEASADSQRTPNAYNSRWNPEKNLTWEPLRPELVAEVAYDHMQGFRFRHTAQFRTWRFDKAPLECTFEQLEVVPAQELSEIFPRS